MWQSVANGRFLMAIAPTVHGKSWQTAEVGARTFADDVQLVRCIWIKRSRQMGDAAEHLEEQQMSKWFTRVGI